MAYHVVDLEWALLCAVAAEATSLPSVRLTALGAYTDDLQWRGKDTAAATAAPATTKSGPTGKLKPSGADAAVAFEPGTVYAATLRNEGVRCEFSLAAQLHEQALAHIFFGEPEGNCVAEPGSASLKGAPTATKGAATLDSGGATASASKPAQLWSDWLSVDMTPLLSDTDTVTVSLGAPPRIEGKEGVAVATGKPRASAEAAAAAPPAGFTYFCVALRVVAARRVEAIPLAELVAGVVARAPSAGKAAKAPPSAGSHKGSPTAQAGPGAAGSAPGKPTVSTPKAKLTPSAEPAVFPPRLLSPELRTLLRPLTITIAAVSRLPAAPSYAAVPPFALLQLPAIFQRASYPDVAGSEGVRGLTAGRVVSSLAVARQQQEQLWREGEAPGAVQWNHSTVVCLGLLPEDLCREALRSGSLEVQVFDRNSARWGEVLSAGAAAASPGAADGGGVASGEGGTGASEARCLLLARRQHYASLLSGEPCLEQGTAARLVALQQAAGTSPLQFVTSVGSGDPSRSSTATRAGSAAPTVVGKGQKTDTVAAAAAPPPTLAVLDALLAAELCDWVSRAGERYAHGAARVRLDTLAQAPPPRSGLSHPPGDASGNGGSAAAADALEITTKVHVRGQKRCGGNTLEDGALQRQLSSAERHCLWPADYTQAGTQVKVGLSLATAASPVSPSDGEAARAPSLFERIVVTLPYEEYGLLGRIQEIVAQSQSGGGGGDSGGLCVRPGGGEPQRLQQPAETSGATNSIPPLSAAGEEHQHYERRLEDGPVPRITGLQVIVGDGSRLLVLEGEQGLEHWAALREAVGWQHGLTAHPQEHGAPGGGRATVLLADPGVVFYERLYAGLGTAAVSADASQRGLTTLKLQPTLPVLLQTVCALPTAAAASSAIAACTRALTQLAELLFDCPTLAVAARLGCFPSTADMRAVMNRFAGPCEPSDTGSPSHAIDGTHNQEGGPWPALVTPRASPSSPGPAAAGTGATRQSSSHRARRSPIRTEQDNGTYLAAKRDRPETDFLTLNRDTAFFGPMPSVLAAPLRTTTGRVDVAGLSNGGSLLLRATATTSASGSASPGRAPSMPFTPQAGSIRHRSSPPAASKLSAPTPATMAEASSPPGTNLASPASCFLLTHPLVSLAGVVAGRGSSAASGGDTGSSPSGLLSPLRSCSVLFTTASQRQREKGFVYPQPHNWRHDIHPPQPPPTRMEEITLPYLDPRDAHALAEAVRKRTGQRRGRPLYRTQMTSPSRSLSRTTFPYVNGQLQAVPDAEFTASVHLPGIAAQEERDQAQRKAEAEWAVKLVIRDPFKYYQPRDATRVDRTHRGILEEDMLPLRKLGLEGPLALEEHTHAAEVRQRRSSAVGMRRMSSSGGLAASFSQLRRAPGKT